MIARSCPKHPMGCLHSQFSFLHHKEINDGGEQESEDETLSSEKPLQVW